MIYLGREIDPVAFWGNYVDFPQNMNTEARFSDLVQCPNPDHHTFKKHFQVDLQKPLVHCFAGCGISGTYERAIAIIEGLKREDGTPDGKRARKTILRSSRVALGGTSSSISGNRDYAREHRDKLDNDVAAFLSGKYQWLPEKARTYLDSRGIDAAARSKWEIGWDEEAGRIVIPVSDQKGALRFLIRRGLSPQQQPKYLYSPESERTSLLYGACSLDRDAVRSAGLILVEGSFDAIRLHQMGFRIASGILGTGLSIKQRSVIDRIAPPRIYLLFDKDLAGAVNILKAQQLLLKWPLFVMRYPSDKDDPAELTPMEVQHSLERALPISLFFQKTGIKRRQHGETVFG